MARTLLSIDAHWKRQNNANIIFFTFDKNELNSIQDLIFIVFKMATIPIRLLDPGSKRQRISTETDHETGSESTPSSPRLKNSSFCLPMTSSPNRNGRPSSPESDLDVDSAPDEATPENLSLKKDDSTSPPHTPIENMNMMRHGAGNGNGPTSGFMPYHQAAHFMGTMPSQRSPIDVLLR